MREYEKVRAAIIRGGTSKGIFILDNDLPVDPKTRDDVILSIYGGSDTRQIDGLGGADALTSKLAIVRASERTDVDVEYTFGQVGVGTGTIDYNSNCGNILSGVGPFAIDEGLVPANEPLTKVRIYNTNTNRIVEAEVPVEAGKAKSLGNYTIDGVPGTGAKILLNFLDAAGAKTGSLFPTGKRKESLLIGFPEIEISIVDVTTPVVFVKAESIGLKGTELHDQLSKNVIDLLEAIRSTVAEKLRFVDNVREATKKTPATPKIIIVSPSTTYTNANGNLIDSNDILLTARAMSMQKMHKTFPVTGGLCTAVAAKLKGTVVYECCSDPNSHKINIGHPSGTMEFAVELSDNGEVVYTEKSAVARTSRRLMEGYAYTPRKLFWQ